jgi:hypothetical protein
MASTLRITDYATFGNGTGGMAAQRSSPGLPSGLLIFGVAVGLVFGAAEAVSVLPTRWSNQGFPSVQKYSTLAGGYCNFFLASLAAERLSPVTEYATGTTESTK